MATSISIGMTSLREKIDYSTIDGEHYGVPVDNGTVVCAYRTDLLEQAGYTIDDLTGCTWDKFMEVGKAVKEKTGKALLCMNSDGNDLPYIMLQAEGVSQFKDGKPYITENETLVTIVEKLVEMAKEGILLMPTVGLIIQTRQFRVIRWPVL